MKKKKLNIQKLSFNKKTVAQFDQDKIRGGNTQNRHCNTLAACSIGSCYEWCL